VIRAAWSWLLHNSRGNDKRALDTGVMTNRGKLEKLFCLDGFWGYNWATLFLRNIGNKPVSVPRGSAMNLA
jgi:hypothetical protein